MNSYLIQKRIRTPIQVFHGLECRGYHLMPIEADLRGGFVVKKEISAEYFREAYQQFLIGLLPILDAASIVTQCAIFSVASSSHCIYRLSENPDHLAFLYYAEETETVGMHLDTEELDDVEKILAKGEETPDERVALGYLRQANLATGPTFFLAMLVIAAEAFAGKANLTRKCDCGKVTKYSGSNKDSLKSILGEELYRKVYVTGKVRHKLFHGGPVEEGRIFAAAKETYHQILLEYLKTRYDLRSVHEIVEPPRSTSFQYTGTFLRLDGRPNLVTLEGNRERFPIVDEPPGY